jgi:hypothetical protein
MQGGPHGANLISAAFEDGSIKPNSLDRRNVAGTLLWCVVHSFYSGSSKVFLGNVKFRIVIEITANGSSRGAA